MTKRQTLRIPIPEDATPEEEAAVVAADPGFQRMMADDRAQARSGRTHEQVWADLERTWAAEEGTSVPVEQAEANFGALLEQAGSGQRITITREGAPSVMLIAAGEFEQLRNQAERAQRAAG